MEHAAPKAEPEPTNETARRMKQARDNAEAQLSFAFYVAVGISALATAGLVFTKL